MQTKPLLARIIASALMCALSVTAAYAAPDRASEVRMASGLGFSTFDPVMASPPTVDYLRPVYDTLVVRRGLEQFEPGLASAWEYLDGNQKLRLTLRKGVTFTDGADFNAEVVKANLERGKNAAGSPWAAVYSAIERVEVVSDYEVLLHLVSSNPAMVEYFSTNPGMMVSPQSMADEAGLAFDPVGTGPWILDKAGSVRGDRYRFTLNNDYWKPEEQPVERVVIHQMVDATARVNALRSGQLDITTVAQTQANALERLGFNIAAPNKVHFLLAAWDARGEVVPALKDERVRRAVSLAIDRTAILRAVYGDRGTATMNFYPEGSTGYSQKLAQLDSHDVAEAKRLLKEAGYADGFEVDAVVQTNNSKMAAAIAGELAKVGVRVNVTVMPDVGSFHRAVHQKKSPIGIFAHQTALPFVLYNSFLSVDGRYNPFRSDFPELNTLASEAAAAPEAQATELYAKLFEEIVHEKALVFPVVHAEIVAAMRAGIDAGSPTYTNAGLPDPRFLTFTRK